MAAGCGHSGHIGIDYSAAEVPTCSLKALRVYAGAPTVDPVEVPPPPSPRKYWTRQEIAEWLVQRFADDELIIVGIDGRLDVWLDPKLDASERLRAQCEGWMLGVE